MIRIGKFQMKGRLSSCLALAAVSITAAWQLVFAVTSEAVPQLEIFRDFGSFFDSTNHLVVLDFDELPTGSSVGNAASFDGAVITHSDPAGGFRTFDDVFEPVSFPNVLAAADASGIALFGDTTVAFDKGTKAAGMFLVLPGGANSETRFVATVIAQDRHGLTVATEIEFQGEIGEQQFIGFRSPGGIASIRFGVAIRTDGAAQSVIGIDNLSFNSDRRSSGGALYRSPRGKLCSSSLISSCGGDRELGN